MTSPPGLFVMNPYLLFLKNLTPAFMGLGAERSSELFFDLGKGRMPVLNLTDKRRADYTHDILWSLQGSPDVQYLKLNYVNLWDKQVDSAKAMYSDYTAMERFNLYGKEHLAEPFYNFIANLTSATEKAGWVRVKKNDVHKWVVWDEAGAEHIVDYEPDNPEVRRELYVVEGESKWVHPDIEKTCHEWLDHQGVEGSSRELIMGNVLAKHVPITGAGMERFAHAAPTDSTRVEKRMPYEHFNSLVMTFTRREVPREAVKEMLVEARAAQDMDDAETKYDQLYMHIPGFYVDVQAQCFRPHALEEVEHGLQQAAVLLHMAAEAFKLLPGQLRFVVAEPEITDGAIERKIIALETAMEKDDAGPTHLFFNPRGLKLEEFQWPLLEYL